jgi:hypothetical protein
MVITQNFARFSQTFFRLQLNIKTANDSLKFIKTTAKAN